LTFLGNITFKLSFGLGGGSRRGWTGVTGYFRLWEHYGQRLEGKRKWVGKIL
jgi:hypothetical protein